MYHIAIIVLNWNNPVDTLACLDTVASEIRRNRQRCTTHLYPVDNGSGDDSVRQITSWIERQPDLAASLVCNTGNLGFAGGMNAGISRARDDGPPDYIWLLNNDLTLHPGALSALLDSAGARPAVAIWGSTVLNRGSDTIQCAGGGSYSPLLGMERKHLQGTPFSAPGGWNGDPPAFDFIYGAAMFIRGDTLQDNNGLDESYFLYYEELELSRRLKPGDELAWCPGSVVSHQGSDAPSRSKRQRANSSYYAAYSACLYTWRYHRLLFLPMLAVRVGGLAIQAVREANPGLALAPWRAALAFVAGRKPGPSGT